MLLTAGLIYYTSVFVDKPKKHSIYFHFQLSLADKEKKEPPRLWCKMKSAPPPPHKQNNTCSNPEDQLWFQRTGLPSDGFLLQFYKPRCQAHPVNWQALQRSPSGKFMYLMKNKSSGVVCQAA